MYIFMFCCHLLEHEFEVKVQYISLSWKTEVSALTEMNLKWSSIRGKKTHKNYSRRNRKCFVFVAKVD